ncbi:MAG: adenylate kinase [Dehalococcoidia bacterium]|nr:adenylate kinase [Dehalococcoidia bacterium]
MRIILLGAPGAGKGTQAATLNEELNAPHIATGDLFRAALSQGTPLGLEAKSYMDRGELVPDNVTVRMLLERISQPDAADGYILDGFPRSLAQAEALDDALKSRNENIDKVLLVDVSEDELVRRLSGRWICRTCQKPFHVINNPPKKDGLCDVCDPEDGELYQRDDDKPETVRNRLGVYQDQTAPLIDYYTAQGILTSINGEQEIESVRADLLAALE